MSEDHLLQRKEQMVLAVAWGGWGWMWDRSPRVRGPQLLVAETGLLKPLDCPGDSNNHGKMHPSPQKEGHRPWEEPRWLQPLPGTGESVGPASMCGLRSLGRSLELLGSALLLLWGLWVKQVYSWDSGYQSPRTAC